MDIFWNVFGTLNLITAFVTLTVSITHAAHDQWAIAAVTGYVTTATAVMAILSFVTSYFLTN